MNYNYQPIRYPREGDNERFVGALLPFLAGVAVTTPFILINRNQNVPYYPYPPMPYPPYYPPYPYRPY